MAFGRGTAVGTVVGAGDAIAMCPAVAFWAEVAVGAILVVVVGVVVVVVVIGPVGV